jgi:hypothetical protein
LTVSYSSTGTSPHTAVLTAAQLHAFLNGMLSVEAQGSSTSTALSAQIVTALKTGGTVTVSSDDATLIVTISSTSSSGGPSTTKAFRVPGRDFSTWAVISSLRDALRSGHTAVLQFSNGTLTLTVSSPSSGTSPQAFALKPGQVRALLSELLWANHGQVGATTGSGALLAEIVRAVDSGGTVTVSISNGTVTMTIPASGSTTTRTIVILPRTAATGSEAATILRALESSGTVQLRVSNGIVTVTVPGTSETIIFRVPAERPPTDHGQVSERAALRAILQAMVRTSSSSQSTQLNQILQALESGGTVTITASHGDLTISDAAGTSVTIPAATISASGTVGDSPPADSPPSDSASVGTPATATDTPVGLVSTVGVPAAAALPRTAGATGAASVSRSGLPFTGNNTAAEAGLAAAVASVGGALAFASRRLFRHPRSGQDQG